MDPAGASMFPSSVTPEVRICGSTCERRINPLRETPSELITTPCALDDLPACGTNPDHDDKPTPAPENGDRGKTVKPLDFDIQYVTFQSQNGQLMSHT